APRRTRVPGRGSSPPVSRVVAVRRDAGPRGPGLADARRRGGTRALAHPAPEHAERRTRAPPRADAFPPVGLVLPRARARAPHRAHGVRFDPRVSVLRANRLAGEKSPYLLQHAHNPVDWHPWDDEAFA